MSNQIVNNDNTNSKKPASDDIINLSDILNKFVYHWPLYVAVLTIAIAFAYIYLKYTKPVYASAAKIYIKDDKGSSAQTAAFTDITGISGNKVVENEMEIIKSPLILQDVIRDNKFNIRYFIKGRLSNKEIYGSIPIEINILTDSSKVGNYDFKVEILDNKNIVISGINDKASTIRTQTDMPFTFNKDRFAIKYYPQKNVNNDRNFEISIDSIMPLAYQKANEVQTGLINRMSTVFELTYEDVIAKRTADFLNSVLSTYNNYTLSDKNAIIKNTIEFINGRLDSLGSELNVVERSVESFKKERGITEIGDNSRLVLDRAREADQRLNESNLQLSVFESVQRYVENPNTSSPLIPVGASDAILTTLIEKFDDLITQRKKLLLSVQPGNVLLQSLDQQISDTRASIKNYISGYKRNALTVRSGLQGRVNRIEGEISKVPTYERQYINIKRQQGVKEQLYLYLLQKKEESSVSYASNIISNKIISPAYIPTVPIKPKNTIIYIACLFAGFVLTTIYVFFKYYFNNKISTKKDIEKITGVPVIAEIFKEEVQTRNGVAFEDRSVLREQILNLRNNLKFLLSNVSNSPVIVFTSSISGEGKTFLSSHLASALTYNNKTVVLMELDLRKPKLSSSLGISNASGVTNYIIGVETIDQVIKKVPTSERLYLVPSGPIPPNPIELLESQQMKEMISTLRERFDYIIIDTSPIGLVSDAKSLAPYVDCALFVTRFNYTPKGKLKEMSENIGSTFFKKMGIIFNGIDVESSFAYYGYGYSKYGYGYGNSNAVANKKVLTYIKSFKRRFL